MEVHGDTPARQVARQMARQVARQVARQMARQAAARQRRGGGWRTVCISRKRARLLSARRLERSTAAAPQRKRQLESSIERSLPRYLAAGKHARDKLVLMTEPQ